MFWNLQTCSLTHISNSTTDLNQFNCPSCFCTFSVFSSLALFCAVLSCALCFLCHRRCFAASSKMTFGQKIRCLSCRVLCIYYIFTSRLGLLTMFCCENWSWHLYICLFLFAFSSSAFWPVAGYSSYSPPHPTPWPCLGLFIGIVIFGSQWKNILKFVFWTKSHSHIKSIVSPFVIDHI